MGQDVSDKRRWAMVATLAMAALVASCGGGGGGGGSAGGPGTPIPGAPPSGPSDPPPSGPPKLPSPTLDVDCRHTGGEGTKEYNVGGPADGANRVAKIADVAWEALNPGDTVRIHWRDTAYAEKLVLFRSGTEGKPIRICGVLGGADGQQRPALTGVGATTRTDSKFKAQLDYTAESLQPFGVVVIATNDSDKQIEHLVIENLAIGNTKAEPESAGTLAKPASFTDAEGKARKYNDAAACIRIRGAKHITIRNNHIENCGDGVFAVSLPDDGEKSITRHLLIEGNYFRHNGLIEDESRHTTYLQGSDITVQFNVFGPMRSEPGVGTAYGNQIKTRAVRLTVRYNYAVNGARMFDFIEPEDFIDFVVPWQWARIREQYYDCQLGGCEAMDAQQAQDWADMRSTAGHVYGNLMHVSGLSNNERYLPSNLVHGCFDNNQLDRQPGVLWFYNNTILVETHQPNHNEVRLFDCGSEGGSSYYQLDVNLKNVGGELHFLTVPNDNDSCTTVGTNCRDWGRMQQNVVEEFGRMRAFNNAIVLTKLDTNSVASDFELTRHLWDQLEIVGPLWLSSTWKVDIDNDSNGGGFPRKAIDDELVYPGGNDAHHITGLDHIVTGAKDDVPIDRATFAPLAGSSLRQKGGPWDTRLKDELKPTFSVTLDPADPRRLILVPRTSMSTIGAVE